MTMDTDDMSLCAKPDAVFVTDADRMENMKELLADLRSSIQAQRHLIDVSRELLKQT